MFNTVVSRKLKLNVNIFMGLVFVLIFMLSLLFINIDDDLYYANFPIHNIVGALKWSLKFGNGRFLGNFLVEIFLYRFWIDKLIRTICIGSIIMLSAKLTDNYNIKGLSLSFLLYIGLNRQIFREVYSWGHGFYNYVPPVTLLLLGVWLLKKYYSETLKINKVLFCAIMAVVGFSQQLFVENSSTINLLCALGILCAVMYKKLEKMPAIIYLIFNSLSGAIMFILPYILGVSHKMDGYRLPLTAERFKVNIIEVIVNLLSIPLVWILLILIYICRRTHKKLPQGTEILLLLSGASVGQLFFAIPTGNRCLFITYTLMSLIILNSAKEFIYLCFSKKALIKVLLIITLALSIVVYTFLAVIHWDIFVENSARIKYAQQQLAEGKTDIELIIISNDKWVWHPNYVYAYPNYFNNGNPNEMKFTFISYEDYLKKIEHT